MNIVLIVISTLIFWTACSSEYVVLFATSIAQISIWITALCNIDWRSFYLSLMCNQNIVNDPKWNPQFPYR